MLISSWPEAPYFRARRANSRLDVAPSFLCRGRHAIPGWRCFSNVRGAPAFARRRRVFAPIEGLAGRIRARSRAPLEFARSNAATGIAGAISAARAKLNSPANFEAPNSGSCRAALELLSPSKFRRNFRIPNTRHVEPVGK